MKVFELCTQEEPSAGKWAVKQYDDSHNGHHGNHHGHHRKNSGGSVDIKASLTALGEHKKHDGDGDEELVGIKRRFCLDCISSLPERLSPQEIMRLMQMLPEDEDGFVMIDELVDYLEHLRTDAMLNALVESDVLSLRTHLVLRFRRLGLGEDHKLSLWVIKDALLQADQVCLTRLQIHLLLCLAVPDAFGMVDIGDFLGMCCAVIPHMFDARLFVETSERLILEHAEASRAAENAELAALGAASSAKQTEDGVEVQENKEVDSDTVERTLQQVLTLNDDVHRTPPALPPETIVNIFNINKVDVMATTQLTTCEMNGFIAEMVPDAEGFVAYSDHIKKWVPIIFEQRKNRLLGRYLEVEAFETLGLQQPDLDKLEEIFPLLPHNSHASKAPVRSGRRSSRRNSLAGGVSHTSKESHADGEACSKTRSPGRMERQQSHGVRSSGAQEGGRTKSKRSTVHHAGLLTRREVGSKEAKAKEPPPGRGFLRRKQRLEAMAAAEAELHHANNPSQDHGHPH
jgi:hypothetical protein